VNIRPSIRRQRLVQARAVARTRPSPSWLFATLLALAVLAALAVNAHAADAPQQAAIDVPGKAPGAPASFADLAERLLPAVVNVSTTQTVKNTDRLPDMPQFPPGSPFEDMFKDFLEKQGKSPDAAPRKSTALGSGFIIDPAGLVVTNNHVIADADEISVILHDGTAYKAKVLGHDSKADLALLKLLDAPAKLPYVPFGNSDESRVGDWVIAIGNPFGLGDSVSAGIVSARARDLNAGPYDDFLQTDAAINKGNSGGPLFNMKGEVIGINTAILSPSGGSIGIGFSIPANLAKPILNDLQKYGKTRRGWLGVHIQTINDEIAESMGLPKDAHGALVANVSPGGPAAKGGLKQGDVITRFDGKDVTEMHRLPRIVAETPINREVEVQFWRDGKKQIAKVTVGELVDEDDQANAKKADKPQPKQDPATTPLAGLGLSVSALTPALRDRFELPQDAKGVVVTDVNPTGQAADKGLRPGDLITTVDNDAVKTPADISAHIDTARKSGRRSILLFVQSGRDMHYVPLKIEKDK